MLKQKLEQQQKQSEEDAEWLRSQMTSLVSPTVE